MFQTGCVERVSYLLKEDSDNKKELTNVFDELIGELNLIINSNSELDLGNLLSLGKISRCFQVEWCIPHAISGEFLPIRYVSIYCYFKNVKCLCCFLLCLHIFYNNLQQTMYVPNITY